jgi:hypothetical protein
VDGDVTPFEGGLNIDRLATVIERNHGWLQDCPRTSQEVLETLFPSLDCLWTLRRGYLLQVGYALYDAGYTPNPAKSVNPLWRCQGVKSIPQTMTTPLFIGCEALPSFGRKSRSPMDQYSLSIPSRGKREVHPQSGVNLG